MKRRIFCYPIVVSLNRVVCKLDGDHLSMEKETFSLSMILTNDASKSERRINTIGFTEVSPEEFAYIAEQDATESSKAKFYLDWIEEFEK